jgi:SAM-dependent methyltransferase
MNAMEIEFPAGTFDIVYAANLLHHLPDPKTALREIHRVLNLAARPAFGSAQAQSGDQRLPAHREGGRTETSAFEHQDHEVCKVAFPRNHL